MTEVPPAPATVQPGVPEDLSAAIMTLIEKNPEDRFQSADEFLAAIRPGLKPASIKLALPDRLYGRDRQIQAMAAEIRKATSGPKRLFRVSGPSGIGKSALLQVMVEPAAAEGAKVLSGKFDQLERTQPYSAFKQAASMLLRYLLAAPADELDLWRRRIADAVHPNGQVLLDLLPDYAVLLGQQPPVVDLGLNEQRIRTDLVFRRFIQALARADRPLILVFDDLQWSDSASRDLMQLLLSDPEIRYLTIVTAYRDTEIGPGHGVNSLFKALRDLGALGPVTQPLPLERRHIAELLSDCLAQTKAEVMGLAGLIAAKTAGNPFFVRQFLLALDHKGLLWWDRSAERWIWDLDRIQAQAMTDNVADLVGERLMDLPPETQRIMQLAACFGSVFEAEALALAEDRAPFYVAQLLKPALQADVIRHAEPGAQSESRAQRYRFQHDRVQAAAYGSLTADQQSHLHARIGGVLLNRTSGAEIDHWLIDITDHLIAGKAHLDVPLRLCLRDLALASAKRTRQANAWDASLRYLAVAEEMLGPEGWSLDPSLMFDVTLQKAEGAYLQNDADRAERISQDLLSRDLPLLNRVRVLELQILIQTSKLNYVQALAIGHQALSLMDQRLPKKPSAISVMRKLAAAKLLLRGKSTHDLLTLPRMTDPVRLAIIRVLGLMAAPAYFTQAYLLPVIGMQIVGLSVRHGNAPHSPYGYVVYGMLHCAVLNRPREGMAYAELARDAVIELGARDIECRVLMVYAGFIQHWTSPLTDTLQVFKEAWEKAIAGGDLEYHGYARYGHASYALMGGKALGHVADVLDDHLGAVTDNPHEKTQRIMLMARASIARMRGLAPDAARLFDARESIAVWSGQRDATSLAYLHKYQMLEALMAADYAEVLVQAEQITANLHGILSMAYQPFYRFYEALALLELAGQARGVARRRLIGRAKKLVRLIERWAEYAPTTLQHRAHLLRAEMAACAGHASDAIAGFEEAIALARNAGALHDMGLFHERTARFYLTQGGEGAAAGHLAEARGAYAIWGAGGWVASLDARFGDRIHAPAPVWRGGADPMAVETTTSGGQIVDSATLIAAAAALAKKTSLGDVVEEVMRAIVVNAGADRGVLALRDDRDLSVVAEALGSEIRLVDPEALDDYGPIPHAIVNTVHRTGTQVVMDDATLDPNFGEDPYIKTARPSSVLCVPLLAKGDLSGVVYLENARVRGVFTPERCRTVEVLGTQAAVSVENARLFDELRSALRRQVELTSAHARFVPRSFLQVLDRPSIDQIELGDHVLSEASILFSDIRGFTAMVEEMGPAEAIEFINAYLSRMEPAVQEGGGFVDSYIGDAVMAVFERGPEPAITAALAMIRGLRAWTHASDTGRPIRIGIGIATGEIMFGTIGAANRMKCGVIGSTVNLASRIEEMTKRYGLGLLITQGTYRSLPDPSLFQIREVDIVIVVGREAPVRLFEVYDADPKHLREQKRRTADSVSRGLRLYRSGAVDQALELFEQCALIAPDDPLIPVMLGRCRRTQDRVRDPEWDGIERTGDP